MLDKDYCIKSYMEKKKEQLKTDCINVILCFSNSGFHFVSKAIVNRIGYCFRIIGHNTATSVRSFFDSIPLYKSHVE